MEIAKITKLNLLLNALADGNWHWGEELATTVGWRFGATIESARKRGYRIETNQAGKQYQYRLLQQ